MKEAIQIKGRVTVVLENKKTGEKKTFETENIVTDAGDLFYAQRAVKTSIPTNFVDGSGDFDGVMELGTAGASPGKASNRSNMTTKVASSEKAMDSTYPKLNDGDADNTGAGTDIVTYRVSYGTSEANGTAIDRLIITNPSPGASEAVLMYATFGSSFNKTSSDTLKVFVNHSLTGS